jgi:hypothetical protein
MVMLSSKESLSNDVPTLAPLTTALVSPAVMVWMPTYGKSEKKSVEYFS